MRRDGGKGLIDLRKIIAKAGARINERRAEREMNPRNVRVAVVGYPNVGKSSLLNRLAGIKKTKVENRAGVTTVLQWSRVEGFNLFDSPGINIRVTTALQWSRVEGFDLLDSPGIIPARMLNQDIAVHLAMFDDIS
ncbi:P-loop containing nucleoside triphosphate hydrolase protein [Baffinella frigidus]|nr:P-loop containing nucleoside triphosphate hydrolase protein [Cryptophyta sp. CCMP2293]